MNKYQHDEPFAGGGGMASPILLMQGCGIRSPSHSMVVYAPSSPLNHSAIDDWKVLAALILPPVVQ